MCVLPIVQKLFHIHTNINKQKHIHTYMYTHVCALPIMPTPLVYIHMQSQTLVHILTRIHKHTGSGKTGAYALPIVQKKLFTHTHKISHTMHRFW